MSLLTRHQLLDLITVIDAEGDGLTPWEITFVAGFIDAPPADITPKQAEVIERIHRQRVLGEER